MSSLTDTRMWRSGCWMGIDEIIHAFLVTLCFPEITRQKRSSSCPRKKVVLRKNLKCCTVVKSVLKLLTPPVRKKIEKVSKCYSGSGLFCTLLLDHPFQDWFWILSLLFNSKEPDGFFHMTFNTDLVKVRKESNLVSKALWFEKNSKSKMYLDFFEGV